MRTCVIASALLACGTPSAQPMGPTPIAEDDRPIRLASIPRADASADATPAIDSAAVATVADTATPDAGEYRENGVRVVYITQRLWCAKGGKFDRFCAPTKQMCAGLGRCHESDSGACSTATDRTSGIAQPLCFETYGKCEEVTDFLATSAEISAVDECTIVRYRK